jgi:hypothetical protein
LPRLNPSDDAGQATEYTAKIRSSLGDGILGLAFIDNVGLDVPLTDGKHLFVEAAGLKGVINAARHSQLAMRGPTMSTG